jgi:hypothetical protein
MTHVTELQSEPPKPRPALLARHRAALELLRRQVYVEPHELLRAICWPDDERLLGVEEDAAVEDVGPRPLARLPG